MIPKIIHYCWFGGNPLPKLAQKCIKSWKKYCPDYEIIEWNESNFDISSAPLYVRQAYELKKWAFVTDYVRLKVVYENGGIYLDTDVELIKPLDSFLIYDSFFGFEHKFIATGLGFGAIKNNGLLKNMMEDYNDIPFILNNGLYDNLPCPDRNSHVFLEYGFIINGKTQIIDNNAVFSAEYFCPRQWDDKTIKLTKNTYSIHHYTASWKTKEEIKKQEKYQKRIKKHIKIEKREKRVLLFKSKIKKILGESFYGFLKKVKRKLKR